jgi:hypothetical protein
MLSPAFRNEGGAMRGSPFRAVVTAAVFAVSTLLLACPLGRLRVKIPDFATSDVRGVRLYRVDDATGQLAPAGSIRFLGLENSEELGGETLAYRQLTAEGDPWFGPLRTRVVRDPSQPAALEVELAFLNQLPAGWFKVASYNPYGTSKPSSGQTFIAAAGS